MIGAQKKALEIESFVVVEDLYHDSMYFVTVLLTFLNNAVKSTLNVGKKGLL